MRVLARHPEIRLREIDITLHPFTAIREGIRLFPACRLEDRHISGFVLSENELRQFIENVSQ